MFVGTYILLLVAVIVNIKQQKGVPILAKTSEFGKAVKIRLIEMDKNQVWLIEQVKDKTGLYFDQGYLWKIIAGTHATPKVVQAICEILGLEEQVSA